MGKYNSGPKHYLIGAFIAAAAVVVFPRPAECDTITFLSEINDAGETGIVQYGTVAYDIIEPTAAGTTTGPPAGYNPFTASVVGPASSAFAFAAASGNTTPGFSAGASYPTVDVPAASGGGTLEPGIFFNNRGSSPTEGDIVSITLGAGAPAAFTIGFMTDVDTDPSDYANAYRLRQVAGVAPLGDSGLVNTGPGSTSTPNAGLDFYFYRVSNAQAGDVLTLSGLETGLITTSSGPQIHLGVSGIVITLASPVPAPEPSSAALVLVGLVGIAAFRRRSLQRPAVF